MVAPAEAIFHYAGVTLRFPYAPEFIETLKVEIPTHSRAWHPATKTWNVDRIYADVAVELLLARWPDARVVRADHREYERSQNSPPQHHDPFSLLFLLPTAPLSVAEAAYRALSKQRHPDVRPESEREAAHREMLSLNDAFKAIRQRLGAAS